MMKKLIARFLFAVCAIAQAATASFTADTTTELITNPERGWYFTVNNFSDLCTGSLAIIRDGGVASQSVRIIMVTLDPTTVTTGAMNTNFACARAGGVKILLRLAYCNSSNCNEGRNIAQVESDVAVTIART